MGEVHLAEDARLGREVALKLLPERFTQDADRVKRFVREAKAASALNHPNILTIFDIGEANGKHYTVTEYIQGETLRRHITTPVTIATALNVGIQMASALGAAHEAGIIHRDIKPENIMLRPDGLVKVLDFGIAKLVERDSPLVSADDGSQDCVASGEYAIKLDPYRTTPEVKSEGTAPGIILGTVTYMSPEQLRRQKIDGRSDIFSLGIVLYELTVGTPPFIGQTQVDKIAAILEHEPEPMVDRRPDVPAELEQIVGKALRKDRDLRYQYVKDMLADLKGLKEELEFQEKLERSSQGDLCGQSHATKSPGRRWRRLLFMGAAALIIIATLIFASLNWRPPRAAPPADRVRDPYGMEREAPRHPLHRQARAEHARPG
jgi:serine/threonine protein kinase